jgi:hypothetical protein
MFGIHSFISFTSHRPFPEMMEQEQLEDDEEKEEEEEEKEEEEEEEEEAPVNVCANDEGGGTGAHVPGESARGPPGNPWGADLEPGVLRRWGFGTGSHRDANDDQEDDAGDGNVQDIEEDGPEEEDANNDRHVQTRKRCPFPSLRR